MEFGDTEEKKEVESSDKKRGRPKGSRNRRIRIFKEPQLHIKKADRKDFDDKHPELVTRRRKSPGRIAGIPEHISTSLITASLRRRAYREYCDWVSQGRSPKSFVFRCGSTVVTGKTMEKYMITFPEDMPEELLAAAAADGLEHWENVGKKMMMGQVKNHDSRIWMMFMKNKFDWDKASNDEKSSSEVHIKALTSTITQMYEKNAEFFMSISSKDRARSDLDLEECDETTQP
jgi:hypothetical protein